MGKLETDEGHLELVRLAVAGDLAALRLLLTEYRPRLRAYLAARIPDGLNQAIDPDDIAQEAYVRVFRHIDHFEQREPNSFFLWLATIAMNCLRDTMRQHQAVKRGGGRDVARTGKGFDESTIALLNALAGPGKTPSRTMARGEAVDAVHAALEKISEDQRRAVWLVHIEGRAVVEAAAAMGRSERAVHGLCRRGLKQLQQKLGAPGDYLSSTG